MKSKAQKPIEQIKKEIESFEAVIWASCGGPKEEGPGWVKFELKKSELGWRTLEFLAWICTDMVRAGERLHFFPTSPPPYLNEPGKSLSFVIECYPENSDQAERFKKVADFIADCRDKHWDVLKQERDDSE